MELSGPRAEMPVASFEFAVIDFESAGEMPGHTDVPIQVGIATRDSQGLPTTEDFRSFIHTSRPISWKASKIHGISVSDLASAPEFSQLWDPIRERLTDRIIIAHNAGTEKKFLGGFPFHGFGPWIDTLELSRKLFPQLPGYSLGELTEIFDLSEPIAQTSPEFQFHDALNDSIASWLVFAKIMDLTSLWKKPLRTVIELSGDRG